jgi:hypothetical protein
MYNITTMFKNIVLKSLLVVIVVASGIGLGSFAPKAAQAEEWPAVLLASDKRVRLEVQPLAYDSTKGNFKYRFTWLMPKRKTYSITIDDKAFQKRLIKNGSVETGFWFFPNITYRIKVFASANGKGRPIIDTTFVAPAAPQRPMPPTQKAGPSTLAKTRSLIICNSAI